MEDELAIRSKKEVPGDRETSHFHGDVPFFFDRNELVARARMHRDTYQEAEPFPSIVLDDFLPSSVAEKIASLFPGSSFAGFGQPDNQFQKGKLSRTQDTHFKGVPPFFRHFLNECNSMAFIDFLETLTGIQGLIPDPHFAGGALHQIVKGGKLAIHADFNIDRRRQLDRRVNVLLYFNKNWKSEYGGDLELWDREMKRCVKKISPILNRCVVFNTASDTYHGHPDPLSCPDGETRKSIALYYYTASQDNQGHKKEHSTLWRARPGTDEVDGDEAVQIARYTRGRLASFPGVVIDMIKKFFRIQSR